MSRKYIYITFVTIGALAIILILWSIFHASEKLETAETVSEVSDVLLNESYKSPYFRNRIDLSENLSYDNPAITAIPNRYSCKDQQIRTIMSSDESDDKDSLYSVVLNDREIPDALFPIFSYDCDAVLFFRDVGADSTFRRALYSYDVASYTISDISWNLTDLPGTEIAGQVYYPVPNFIFPLTTDTLFVSFETVTTGKDYSTNFTLQGLYDIPGKKLTLINAIETGVYISRPVLFDYVQKQLVYAQADTNNSDGAYRTVVVYDLTTRKMDQVLLVQPYEFPNTLCDVTVKHEAYKSCVDNIYKPLVEKIR